VGPAAELDDDDITIEAAALLDVPAFFEALGLDASSITADMGAALAQMVRASFQGLLEVERARSQFESRLRLKRPRVPTDPARNPLKSAASVEEALGALLRSRPPGALSPRDAVEDVFDDLRFQHLSMLAGMRAGFASVMTRFDPRKLMAQANQGKQKGLSGLAAKARYWDRFIELFDHAVTYPDAGLQRSYCEEFYDAYGRQLEELKRHHRINGSL
jgi:type VI secretion system FHA domain protein